MKISMSDMRTFLQRRRAEPAEFGNLVFGRWSCACQDADGVLFAMFHSDSIWGKYKSSDLDKLLEAGRNALDPQDRLSIYRKVHEHIEKFAPSVPLYQASAIYGANRKLSWQPTPNESMFLMDMKWSN